MPSSPLHVFIDTSTYEAFNFDWDGKQLARLADHASEERVVLHITETTRREVERRLRRHAKEASDALQRLNGRLRSLGVEPSTTSVPDADVAIAKFSEFLAAVGAVTHDAAGVDCNELIVRYFDEQPPFSKTKPDEFRDAIAAISLREWASGADEILLVVAEDGDWRATAAEFDEFESLRLGQVLERLEAMRVEHLAEFKQRIALGLADFQVALTAAIVDLWPVLADRWEDEADAFDLQVENNGADAIDIVEADPVAGTASIVLSGPVDVSVSVRYGDDNLAYYDSEEKERGYMGYVKRHLDRTVDVTADLELSYDRVADRLVVEYVGTNLGDTFDVFIDDEDDFR